MPRLADALRRPLPLGPNRIERFYRGGRLLDAFRGADDPTDDDRPEDWVGSATTTWSRPGTPTSSAGLSTTVIDGERITLAELVDRDPEGMIGSDLHARIGPSLGLLVKLLDAGERLPVHCHPTRDLAARQLGSRFGKTEAWTVLGTRPGAAPRVWVGLRHPVSSETWASWIGDQRIEEMLEALVEQPVQAGDAILVPAGTPHAIGAGVFLLELQEPTDFSIVAERRGFPIAEADALAGLDLPTAAATFATRPAASFRQVGTEAGAGVRTLLGSDADPFFRAMRQRVTGSARLPFEPTFAIGVVLAGSGSIQAPRGSLELVRGRTVAVPAIAAADVRLEGTFDVIWCLPPTAAALDRHPLPSG